MGIGEEWGKRVWVDWQKALGLLKLQLPQAFRFHYPHNTVHDHHLLSTWEPPSQGWFQGVIDKAEVTEPLELWSIPLICIISPVRACILAGPSSWTQTLSLTHSQRVLCFFGLSFSLSRFPKVESLYHTFFFSLVNSSPNFRSPLKTPNPGSQT